MTSSVDECKAQMESETRLQPGEEGWWRLWGARTYHIKVGDVIVTLDQPNLLFDEVVELEDKPTHVRYKNQDGNWWTMGHGNTKWLLYRKGTKNTLAS